MARIPKLNVLTTKSTLLDLFEDLDNQKIESQSVTEFDLLVLSCCAHRLNKQFKHYTINTSHIVKNVNDLDIALANKIRDHYSKKLMFLTLKGIRLTKFREDLAKFLHGNFHHVDGRYQTPDSFIGLATRLPQFYEYDKDLEKLFDDDTPVIKEKHIRGNTELTFTKKFFVKKKLGNYFEFWFTDSNNIKYLISFHESNILTSFLENYLNNHKKIIAIGDFYVKYKDNYQHYSSHTVELKEI
jgi:hypothetical protein